MPRTRDCQTRCENPTCSKTDLRRIAIGSYYTNLPQEILTDANRFMYKGNRCAEGAGEGHFLCYRCVVKLNICATCAHQTCVCKNESTD